MLQTPQRWKRVGGRHTLSHFSCLGLSSASKVGIGFSFQGHFAVFPRAGKVEGWMEVPLKCCPWRGVNTAGTTILPKLHSANTYGCPGCARLSGRSWCSHRRIRHRYCPGRGSQCSRKALSPSGIRLTAGCSGRFLTRCQDYCPTSEAGALCPASTGNARIYVPHRRAAKAAGVF